MTVTRVDVCATPDGAAVERIVLANKRGMRVGILTWGAIIDSIVVPDRQGVAADVVLGFDDPARYLEHHPSFGVIVGRYANRIAQAQFTLDGTMYRLAANNGRNALHGGVKNFSRQLWRADASADAGPAAVRLRYTSVNGEEGYPGNLDVAITYVLDDDNGLHLQYEARTDSATVVNLTNHSYFNLAGQGTILQHEIALAAEKFLPVDAYSIPTGEFRDVAGTAMDFRASTRIASRLDTNDAQLRAVNDGYDHTFVVGQSGPMKPVARVADPQSGRALDVTSTQPGVQFYTANNLDGSIVGKAGQRYEKYAALCLETHHFPDSPNHPAFPSTVLRPGERFAHETVYRFSIDARER
jgi:aldose 1-epimerase